MNKTIKIILLLLFLVVIVSTIKYILYYRNSSKVEFLIDDKKITRCIPNYDISYEKIGKEEYIGIFLPHLNKWCIPPGTMPPFIGNSYLILVLDDNKFKDGIVKAKFGQKYFHDIDVHINQRNDDIFNKIIVKNIDSSSNIFKYSIADIDLSKAENNDMRRYYKDMKEFQSLYENEQTDLKFGDWLDQKYYSEN